jgi:hypothetical protein
MKRFSLSFGTLMLTFIIGVYVSGLALRVASQFTLEVDPQSVPPVSYEVIACGPPKIGTEAMLRLQSQLKISGQDSTIVVIEINR